MKKTAKEVCWSAWAKLGLMVACLCLSGVTPSFAGAPPLPFSLSGTAAQCAAKYMVINHLAQQFGQKNNDGLLDRIVATAALSAITGGEKQFFSAYNEERGRLKPALDVFNQSKIDSTKGFETIRLLNESAKPCLALDKEIQTQQPGIVKFLTSPAGVAFQKKLAQSMP